MSSWSQSAFNKVQFICFLAYLIFERVPNLCVYKKRPCGAMRFFRPTVVVADDVCDSELADKLRKQWALLRMPLDWVCLFIRQPVWDLSYPFGQISVRDSSCKSRQVSSLVFARYLIYMRRSALGICTDTYHISYVRQWNDPTGCYACKGDGQSHSSGC